MNYETIQVEVEDGLAIITLDRPEVRNAINQQMVDELHVALESLETHADVRALILTSSGGKAFMSGADIAELRDRRSEDALKGINANLFARLERFPRPTVAAVIGWCLGGGCELALCCDFRVAGLSSRFGQPEVGLGIMAAAGATRRLPALIGLGPARRLLFTGEIIDAEEAQRMGLVDQLAPDELVMSAARSWLEPILKQAPEAVRGTKRAVQTWVHGADEEELLALDNAIQSELFESPDKFARMDAFLARRANKKK